jgi:hypothetical protein
MRSSRVVRASEANTLMGLIPVSSDTKDSEGAADEYHMLNKVV